MTQTSHHFFFIKATKILRLWQKRVKQTNLLRYFRLSSRNVRHRVLFVVCRDLYGVMSGMAYISCILMLMYATDSTYRLSYFISANLLTITIPLTLLVTIVTLTNKKQQPQVRLATYMHAYTHAHPQTHTHTSTTKKQFLKWRNQSKEGFHEMNLICQIFWRRNLTKGLQT